MRGMSSVESGHEVNQGRLFRSRQQLLDAGVHRNRRRNTSFDSVQNLESLILDSERTCTDSGTSVEFQHGSLPFEKNLQSGIPIRIIRAHSLDSPFAPVSGYRYDGLYQVATSQIYVEVDDDSFVRLTRLDKQDRILPPAKEPFQSIIETAKSHDYDVGVGHRGPTSGVYAWTRYGAVIHVGVDPTTKLVQCYIYFRTASFAPGDRTDWHDIVPTVMAVFFRYQLQLSLSLYDDLNPATGVPTELYGRYILIDQLPEVLTKPISESLPWLNQLYRWAKVFGYLFPRTVAWSHSGEECDERYSFKAEAEQWAQHVRSCIGERSSSETDTFNFRWHPDWHYYRSIRREVSVIESEPLAKSLEALRKTDSEKVLTTEVGSFFVVGSTANFVDRKIQRQLGRVLKQLNPDTDNVLYIPLETHAIAVASPYVVARKIDCGIRAFNRARSGLRERYEFERAWLFPPVSFEWADNIDDDEFEALVLQLLVVEPHVVRARRSGSSRDADQGRDLIIEWETVPLRTDDHTEGRLVVRRIVGQCKTSSGSIGKSDVKDIRDTVEHHGATGYFLASSSTITSDLATHLDRLKERNSIWTEWWGRAEIETRLRRNDDIVSQYSRLVKARNAS
jgi:hypothetical protein